MGLVNIPIPEMNEVFAACELFVVVLFALVISNWLRIRDKMEWFTALKHMGAILDTGNRGIQRLSATSACALLAVSAAQCS